MNPSSDSPDTRWARLAARARSDTPPPLDVSGALRAARRAAAHGATSRPWLDEFTDLFATPRRLLGCGGFAALALAVAVWFGSTFWKPLEPWADLVGSALEEDAL